MPKKTPFAFVLVKWKGSNAEPITKAHAEHMFTAAGRGTNVVDWFDENTHGNIDMTGNQVFGSIDLAISKDDWAAAGSGPLATPRRHARRGRRGRARPLRVHRRRRGDQHRRRRVGRYRQRGL